jgi:hypothetical protein
LTEDHITASPIQNQRFENERMSMTSKRVDVQFTGDGSLSCFAATYRRVPAMPIPGPGNYRGDPAGVTERQKP